jgi:hypothetical protein
MVATTARRLDTEISQRGKEPAGCESSKGEEMTVISVTTLTVKPDKYEDFLATNRQAKALLGKAGAKNIRLLFALTAGEASGSFVLTSEADDLGAAGTVLDKFLADPEGVALFQTVNSSTGPTATFGASTWIEVPL